MTHNELVCAGDEHVTSTDEEHGRVDEEKGTEDNDTADDENEGADEELGSGREGGGLERADTSANASASFFSLSALLACLLSARRMSRLATCWMTLASWWMWVGVKLEL